MVARGELNVKDVLVARREGAIAGAVFAGRLPGGVAVVWPPRAAGDDAVVEDALTTGALSHVRGPAPVAQTLYEETPQSIEARAKAAEARRLAPEPAQTITDSRLGRPTKVDRRKLADWHRWSAEADES